MKWFLLLLLRLVITTRDHMTGAAPCLHPILEIVSGKIEQTEDDGRWWAITVQCQTCHETWRDLKVKTKHAF